MSKMIELSEVMNSERVVCSITFDYSCSDTMVDYISMFDVSENEVQIDFEESARQIRIDMSCIDHVVNSDDIHQIILKSGTIIGFEVIK